MDNQKIYGIVLILCLIISNLYLYRKCSKLNTDIKQLLRRIEELENKTNNYDLFMANFVYKQNNQTEIKKHKKGIVHNVDNDEVDDDDYDENEIDDVDDDVNDDVHDDDDDEVNNDTEDVEDNEIEVKTKVNKNTQQSKENKKKSSNKNNKKENTQMLSQLDQLDNELNKELQDLSNE